MRDGPLKINGHSRLGAYLKPPTSCDVSYLLGNLFRQNVKVDGGRCRYGRGRFVGRWRDRCLLGSSFKISQTLFQIQQLGHGGCNDALLRLGRFQLPNFISLKKKKKPKFLY